MSTAAIATAADYADAMLVARRAKNLLVLLLLAVLLAQLTLFFLYKFDVIKVGVVDEPTRSTTGINTPDVTVSGSSANVESAPTTVPAVVGPVKQTSLYESLTGTGVFVAVASSLVLSAVLMLLVKIMLVGRLIGAGRVTSAYVWTIVLIVVLLPWQYFVTDDRMIPGVLWTWGDMTRGVAKFGSFSGDTLWPTVLGWFRFVVAPLVAIVLLLVIQLKSNRGLRMALGEDEVVVAVETV